MHEDTWQVLGKLLSAWVEGAAVVLAGLGLLTHRGRTLGIVPIRPDGWGIGVLKFSPGA